MRPKLRPRAWLRAAGLMPSERAHGERRGNLLALDLAPADRGGQPSSACKFVLVGLANHAGPDGTGASPSVATLVRYTGLSERTVRNCLHRLAAEGIISPCDPKSWRPATSAPTAARRAGRRGARSRPRAGRRFLHRAGSRLAADG